MVTDKKIISLRKNCMGTLSIEAKFKNMRSSQEFIVYPVGKNDSIDRIKIQSDTRIGYINLNNGVVTMSKPVSSGAYNHHLMFAKELDTLSQEELDTLKNSLVKTAGSHVGNNSLHITTDNSGVINII